MDKMEAVTAPLRSFPGLVDLQVLAVSNARLLTHARWSPSQAAVTKKGQYVSGPSTHAAKRALILFVLKDFLSGAPDTIVQGGFAFEVVGKAVPAGDRVRRCGLRLKDRRALDAMLAICQKNHAALEDLRLLEIQAADRDASRRIKPRDTKMNLDSAALQFGAIPAPIKVPARRRAGGVHLGTGLSMDPTAGTRARPGLERAPHLHGLLCLGRAAGREPRSSVSPRLSAWRLRPPKNIEDTGEEAAPVRRDGHYAPAQAIPPSVRGLAAPSAFSRVT